MMVVSYFCNSIPKAFKEKHWGEREREREREIIQEKVY